ncbi:NAD(P)/FAD-dependent oxidoreductase [Curvibacter sp. CHRR-16]|uniref:NAD(P)/FAD-dependent oxidoreductase n=1 Tax=Curvibacter sp. CHRR-16 TaxID=2835872 RepID=UPI001BD99988|nr:NAD(P)/FAD-dependent oxidoreductase [Curvibacter sp. CHRR-16]MBT0571485.1 NAD(P)/FAD-dependent oxidoreductase [Curvibacter sp. CHRR-16]
MSHKQEWDAIIVGAGAAGLFCAGVAGQRGLRVLLIDHAPKVAEKIRISGGGRCNFTNLQVSERNYLGANPRFAKSALTRFTPADFVALVQRYGIAFHEKHKGQLFCDRSADDIIQMLLTECDKGRVERWQPCSVRSVRALPVPHENGQTAHGSSCMRYEIDSDRGVQRCHSLVVATGGLPIAQIGASDWGLQLAKQFGIAVQATRPALVPLTFDAQAWAPFAALAGLSLPVRISTGSKKQAMQFDEDLLFTHRGLSGPAVLQISSYWQAGTPIRLNLLAGQDSSEAAQLEDALLQAKRQGSRKLIANTLAQWLPQRLADTWVAQGQALGHQWERPVVEASDNALRALAERLLRWDISPSGTEGYRKAEVMAGGVDTSALSSQSMECQQQPGLHFIGEVVDITGWLGGYNFQWAWSSAWACAQALEAQ